MKLSKHAITQYCVRTGRSLSKVLMAEAELLHALKTSKKMSLEEARLFGFTVESKKQANTRVWQDALTHEWLCGVVRNSVLVTVLLTEESMHAPAKTNKCKINTTTGRKYYV